MYNIKEKTTNAFVNVYVDMKQNVATKQVSDSGVQKNECTCGFYFTPVLVELGLVFCFRCKKVVRNGPALDLFIYNSHMSWQQMPLDKEDGYVHPAGSHHGVFAYIRTRYRKMELNNYEQMVRGIDLQGVGQFITLRYAPDSVVDDLIVTVNKFGTAGNIYKELRLGNVEQYLKDFNSRVMSAYVLKKKMMEDKSLLLAFVEKMKKFFNFVDLFSRVRPRLVKEYGDQAKHEFRYLWADIDEILAVKAKTDLLMNTMDEFLKRMDMLINTVSMCVLNCSRYKSEKMRELQGLDIRKGLSDYEDFGISHAMLEYEAEHFVDRPVVILMQEAKLYEVLVKEYEPHPTKSVFLENELTLILEDNSDKELEIMKVFKEFMPTNLMRRQRTNYYVLSDLLHTFMNYVFSSSDELSTRLGKWEFFFKEGGMREVYNLIFRVVMMVDDPLKRYTSYYGLMPFLQVKSNLLAWINYNFGKSFIISYVEGSGVLRIQHGSTSAVVSVIFNDAVYDVKEVCAVLCYILLMDNELSYSDFVNLIKVFYYRSSWFFNQNMGIQMSQKLRPVYMYGFIERFFRKEGWYDVGLEGFPYFRINIASGVHCRRYSEVFILSYRELLSWLDSPQIMRCRTQHERVMLLSFFQRVLGFVPLVSSVYISPHIDINRMYQIKMQGRKYLGAKRYRAMFFCEESSYAILVRNRVFSLFFEPKTVQEQVEEVSWELGDHTIVTEY